jgi:ABC-type nitrate/sulfonate/bicarbonate transport system substrate-binding protein
MRGHGRSVGQSLGLAVSLALVVAGSSPAAWAQAKKKVVVAVGPSSDMALLIVAVKKSFLEQQGLDPQLKIFDSSPQAMQVVVAGQADITMNTEPPHLGARARGGKVVQVMTGWVSGRNAAIVVRSDAITKLEDFVAKTIGTQRGSGSNYHLVWFLARHKLPADKVTLKYMAAPDQIAALARNDIQAFASWEPYVTRAVQTIPQAKLWSRAGDDGVEFRDNVLMREELARNDKDTAVRIVRGLIETADWMNANLREAARVANEVLRAPSEEDAYRELQLFKYPGDFRKNLIEHMQKMAEWAVSLGLFSAPDPKKLVEELVYPDIIKAAAPHRTDM